MGSDREGKSGGGFFQLFDWKAKSRKKLFSNKSPELSKQGKRSFENLPATWLHLVDEDETRAGTSIREGSDYSCASSVTDEDGYGAKPPGVVARLMGLDSLPTNNFSEPYSTPFFETQSLRDIQCRGRNHNYQHDSQSMYSGNLLYNNRMDGASGNFSEQRPQKTQSKPIEKFQSEVLPPKSAKSIPISHHKLLSPIKKPGSFQMKNAAHIMEAAVRILEASPQQAVSKTRIPLVGSSSVPIKVRDLKEKMEAARKTPFSVRSKGQETTEKSEAAYRTSRLAENSHRPVESKAAKCLKGQALNKSWNGSVNTPSRSENNEEDLSSSKNKGKSVSLAIQAKVNVQKRERLSFASQTSSVDQKEQNYVFQPFKSQPNIQKDFSKKSPVHSSSGVLRQNNQKQNRRIDKDRSASKQFSDLQGRKVIAADPSYGRMKNSGKIVGHSKNGSRKLGLDGIDSEKGAPYSSSRNYPRKKRSIERDFNFEKNQTVLFDKNKKTTVQCNPVIGSQFNSWTEESKRKGMDVVSFTFTSPMTRSLPGSDVSSQLENENWSKRPLLETNSINLSNVVGGDALSLLLEQKLRELSYGPNSHQKYFNGPTSSSSSVSEDLMPTRNTGISKTESYYRRDQDLPFVDNSSSHSEFNLFSSSKSLSLGLNHKFQVVEDQDSCSSNVDAKRLLDCRHPSPVSVLEHSISNESCNSSDTADISSLGNKHCSSSVQGQEILGLTPLKKLRSSEVVEMDLSDSASSSSTVTTTRKNLTRSSNWEELDYVKQMLSTVEFMFKDFALGQSCQIINPHMFDQLEIRVIDDDDTKLRRKLLFDCVSECLDLRCKRFASGGYRAWVKGQTTVRNNERLAEEVNNEISSWKGMGDCMVDELVDKDMSSQHGRWLDYEVDVFSLGVEIECQIFNSLVDEVIAGVFVV
ncbi:hypothetical protein ACFE04_006667 [Oxalis oulophora]